MKKLIFPCFTAFALAYLVAVPAQAFEPLSPPGYTPRASNSLTFSLNPNMPSGSTSDQEAVVQAAMDAWNDQGGADFEFRYDGTTSVSDYYSAALDDDGVQVIVADSCGQYYDGSCICDGSVLAYTIGAGSDPDIVVCDNHTWYVSTATSPSGHDLVSVLVHELGHTLGLDHSGHPDAIMYSSLAAGVLKRDLLDTATTPMDAYDGGDVQGIQYLYGAADSDNDGYATSDGDCDDADNAVNPGASEVCGDGIDNDCNGSDLSCNDVDNDGDSYTENGGDCDDAANTTYPGATDACDGVDNDCDGLADADCDSDSDGLTNREEVGYGTDAYDADSDDDGLNDGDEVLTHGTDPLDADSEDDGLSDGAEVGDYGSDPKNGDTDGDTLGDGAEVGTWDTSPVDSDSDADGLDDGYEAGYSDIMDPAVHDSGQDADADGLSNLQEFENATWPDDADSDDDALNDGPEVLEYGTNPLDEDTDDESLLDGEEVSDYGTDPLDPDTDDDVWTDADEVGAPFAKDPLKVDPFVVTSVAHDFGGAGWATWAAVFADGTWDVVGPDGREIDFAGTWLTGFGSVTTAPVIGDFDGDGADDAAVADPISGVVFWALNVGTAFDAAVTVSTSFAADAIRFDSGDFDGDGRDDIVAFDADGGVRVAVSTGARFRDGGTWLTVAADFDDVLVGDFDGDSLADLLFFTAESGAWDVALSDGASFATPSAWQAGFAADAVKRFVVDLNGDGRDDVVAYEASGDIRVAESLGGVFLNRGLQGGGFGVGADQILIGDADGDCVPDLTSFTATDGFETDVSAGSWTVARYNGTYFESASAWTIEEGTLRRDGICDDETPEEAQTQHRVRYRPTPINIIEILQNRETRNYRRFIPPTSPQSVRN